LILYKNAQGGTLRIHYFFRLFAAVMTAGIFFATVGFFFLVAGFFFDFTKAASASLKVVVRPAARS
jgi:hypothetical protein